MDLPSPKPVHNLFIKTHRHIKGGAMRRLSAILIIKNRFFESQPAAGFQKTDFGVSSAYGAGNTKIGFIMRIARNFKYCSYASDDTL
jgi:hypothetical protein